MTLSFTDRVGEGAIADVFATDSPDLVCKLYRSAGSDRWRKWAPKVHEAEAQAYRIAHDHPVLRAHVPRFEGVVSVRAVLDGARDRSSEYLLDTGLLLERLHGDEEKATGLDPAKYPHMPRLVEQFYQAGLDVGDSSAFRYDDPAAVKFIDILTRGGARLLTQIF